MLPSPLQRAPSTGQVDTSAFVKPCCSRTVVLPSSCLAPATRTAKRLVCNAATEQTTQAIVFEPFAEVKGELTAVGNFNNAQSFARLDYHQECEAGVNEQINIELNIAYVYHSLFAYFDRDNVGLPGLAKYFREGSDEERGHAELLMRFQNIRGGRVRLMTIVAPEVEYSHEEKGDALYAMELALSLEKLNFSKLRLLHDVACKHDDAHMADFIEGELLQEQAKAVKQAAVYVSQLRRVGKGHGVWNWDRQLAEEGIETVA